MSDIYDEVSSPYTSSPEAQTQTMESLPSSSTDSTDGKADAAREQAGQLKDTALDSGAQVADTAKNEAGKVVGEAKTQAKDLFAQTQSELREQAAVQQKRVAAGVRSVSDELSTMANASDEGGVAADLVQQAATRAGSLASWLEGRDPGSLLSDVRAYASRKPGTFIAVAAIAGLVAGRLTRSLVSNSTDEKNDESVEPNVDSVQTVDRATLAPAFIDEPAYIEPEYVEPVQVPTAGSYLGDRA